MFKYDFISLSFNYPRSINQNNLTGVYIQHFQQIKISLHMKILKKWYLHSFTICECE